MKKLEGVLLLLVGFQWFFSNMSILNYGLGQSKLSEPTFVSVGIQKFQVFVFNLSKNILDLYLHHLEMMLSVVSANNQVCWRNSLNKSSPLKHYSIHFGLALWVLFFPLNLFHWTILNSFINTKQWLNWKKALEAKKNVQWWKRTWCL